MSISLSVQEKTGKIYFQDGRHYRHLGFQIGTILAIFDLRVTQMLTAKFRINWPFGSGEEGKSRFSRWLPGRTAWISDRNDFSYFLSSSHPDDSYKVLSQLAFRFRKRRKKRFSRWLPWRPSWVFDWNDFSYFWSTSHPDASYQGSTGLSVQEKKCKIDFQVAPWWPSWISDRNDFTFLFTSHPDASSQVSIQLAFRFRRRSEK